MTRLHDLWRRARRPDATADDELLRRFDRSGDEAAFAELVARYGPVVYGACRRLLPDPADVEDAFQATFLVLVTRAGSLSGVGLGPWLYRVAVWTARNLRRRNQRRAGVALGSQLAAPASPSIDLRLDLDAALMALPARDRTPVVLCYLRGWSRREAALHLGCPEGTLSARLSRALVKLRRRLGGADPTAVLAAVGVIVPVATADAAVRSAVLFHSSSHSAAALTPAVADLTQGVLRMFWVKKAVAVGLAVVAVAAAGLGVGLTGSTGPRANAQVPTAAKPAADDLKAKQAQLDVELQESKAQMQAAQARLELLEVRKKDLDDLIRRRAEAVEKVQADAHLSVVVSDTRPGQPPLITVTEFDKGNLTPLPYPYTPGSDVPIWMLYSSVSVSGATTMCADVGYLRRHLARVRKDPTGPTKLFVRVDSTDPANKERATAVVSACKEAGFPAFELEPAKPRPKPNVKGFREAQPPYTIEPPDILKIDAYVRLIPNDAPVDANGVLRELPVRTLASGEYLVRPDGTVSLGKYGTVSVAGENIETATAAIRKHLSEQNILTRAPGTTTSLVVVIDVVAVNSKKCYVITDGPNGAGEQVTALSLTGNETVLDVIARAPGVPALAAAGEVTLDRPGSGGVWHGAIDWVAITKHGKTATNYQVLPGDRLYVKPKPVAARP